MGVCGRKHTTGMLSIPSASRASCPSRPSCFLGGFCAPCGRAVSFDPCGFAYPCGRAPLLTRVVRLCLPSVRRRGSHRAGTQPVVRMSQSVGFLCFAARTHARTWGEANEAVLAFAHADEAALAVAHARLSLPLLTRIQTTSRWLGTARQR